MSQPQILLLTVIALLQAKHLIFDFILQTTYQVQHKGIYGHRAGITHCVGHLVGSIPAILVAGTYLVPALVILVGEFLFHYHVDWSKARLNERYGWTPADGRFWHALGADQALHQATYLIMAPLLLIYS